MVRGGGFLAAIPADDLRSVRATMRRRRFARGEVIFHEGDPAETLHVIDKGHVAIRATTPLGDSATFTILGVGDTFGELTMLQERSYRSASAVALVPTETLSMARPQFEELRRSGPGVDRFLQAVLAEQVERLSTHLLEALHFPADKRILRRLLDAVQAFERTPGAVGPPSIPLTQDDLASLAGTTRPTANRLLKALEKEGVVAVSRGRVTVVDVDELRRRAR